jgi:hypothetical protein
MRRRFLFVVLAIVGCLVALAQDQAPELSAAAGRQRRS